MIDQRWMRKSILYAANAAALAVLTVAYSMSDVYPHCSVHNFQPTVCVHELKYARLVLGWMVLFISQVVMFDVLPRIHKRIWSSRIDK